MDVPAIAPIPTLQLIPTPTTHLASSISVLPYDILLEIFAHCLPRYPLLHWQPNIKTAPILLCHICSSWRRLVIASAALWVDLSYDFTGVETYINSAEFKERDIEFIRWWNMHHGQIPPFLSFNVHKPYHVQVLQKQVKSDYAFLLEYFTSAQYLDLDPFFWNWLIVRQQSSLLFRFPNLHTALMEPHHTAGRTCPLYELLKLLPRQALPALRRLFLSMIVFSASDFKPPAYWAALTHMSLHCALFLPVWHTVIRALPRLRWGHFDLIPNSSPFGITAGAPPPPWCTLPDLITLSIVIHGMDFRGVFPSSFLFMELHLPALRTLSLSNPGPKIWQAPSALSELYTILASVPGITTLALEDLHISLPLTNYRADAPPTSTTLCPATGPIWAHAPHLAHIQLTLPPSVTTTTAARKEHLVHFVHTIFSPGNTWLDLQNAACPIHTVTISNSGALDLRGEQEMEWARKWTGEVPRVKLEVIEKLAGLVATDVRKEWGRI